MPSNSILDSPLIDLDGAQVLVSKTKELLSDSIDDLDSSIAAESKKVISGFGIVDGKIDTTTVNKITISDVATSGNASDLNVNSSNTEAELEDLAEGKCDGLAYDDTTSTLSLLSGNTVLSTAVVQRSGGTELDDITGLSITVNANTATLTWSDPNDVIIEGVPVATWEGTLVLRKIGSAPADKTDGTIVVDSKIRNQYSSTGYVDTGLNYDTTYYYRFFPYTTTNKYTDGSSGTATPTRTIIPAVPAQSGTITYDGTEKTATWNSDYDSTKMTVTGNTATNAGTYTASFTPTEGYCWSDGTTTAKTANWSINKATVVKPEQTGSLTYNGSAQSPTWDANYDNTKMTVSGNTQTNAGSYTATFSLIDTANYQWGDTTITDKTSTWSIGKASGAFTLSTNSVTLNASNPSATVTATVTGDGTISAISSDANVASVSVSGTTITISGVNNTSGSATVTVSLSETTNYTAPSNQTVSVTASFLTIYGAEWDGSSSPAWTRTDASANFSDPVPAVNNGTGSSPFDNCMPWSGMRRVTDSEAGELVEIPKFWYKWTYSGLSMKLQIADGAVDGFLVSPAHADRDDGKGERDYVYVGRYHCATSTYKSTTGVLPANNYTRASFRSYIHNLDSDIWQYDFAMYWTIRMLYLVEFADWNSHAKIGYGCSPSGSAWNMGYTDSMQYHTGTTAANRTTYGGTQYRYIEGLWDNVYDFCDGIYFSSYKVYVIKNPASFSDTSGGTYVSTRSGSGNYISAWNEPTTSGFEYALYPSENNGTSSTYVCDFYAYSRTGVALVVGGCYDRSMGGGLFFLAGSYKASDKSGFTGSRLQKLPASRLSPP